MDWVSVWALVPGGENAGFTSGTPWFKVNPRYKEINVEEALKDQDSVFHYYQKLIRLRHEEDILTEGSYRLLLPEDESLFVYEREYDGKKWLVAANLTGSPDYERILSMSCDLAIESTMIYHSPRLFHGFPPALWNPLRGDLCESPKLCKPVTHHRIEGTDR